MVMKIYNLFIGESRERKVMGHGEGYSVSISRSRYDGLLRPDGVARARRDSTPRCGRRCSTNTRRKSRGSGHEPFDIKEDYPKYVDGKPRYNGVKSFLDARGIDIPYGTPDDSPDMETVCGLGNRKNRLFLRMMKTRGVEVYESSVKLIEDLRSRGFRVAVASSSRNCAEVLESAGIAHLFDAKVDGIDIESLDLKGKPDADMFLEAVAAWASSPRDAWCWRTPYPGAGGARGRFRAGHRVDRKTGGSPPGERGGCSGEGPG